MKSILPGAQKTNSFYKSIREREAAEKKRLEKWRKEFRNNKMEPDDIVDYTSSYLTNNTSTWQYSSGGLTAPATTVRSTSIADAKIHIDGGENGSMRVDVPLVVNGRDVMREIDEMRDALLLLKRDVDMEKKYPRLKEIKDEYEAALAKYATFDTLKGSK